MCHKSYSEAVISHSRRHAELDSASVVMKLHLPSNQQTLNQVQGDVLLLATLQTFNFINFPTKKI